MNEVILDIYNFWANGLTETETLMKNKAVAVTVRIKTTLTYN